MREIIKTYRLHIFFLFFRIMERIRKESDLPKKKVGVTKHPTKIFADQVTAKVISSIFCWVSIRCARLKHMTWHAPRHVQRAQERCAVAMGANVLNNSSPWEKVGKLSLFCYWWVESLFVSIIVTKYNIYQRWQGPLARKKSGEAICSRHQRALSGFI